MKRFKDRNNLSKVCSTYIRSYTRSTYMHKTHIHTCLYIYIYTYTCNDESVCMNIHIIYIYICMYRYMGNEVMRLRILRLKGFRFEGQCRPIRASLYIYAQDTYTYLSVYIYIYIHM